MVDALILGSSKFVCQTEMPSQWGRRVCVCVLGRHGGGVGARGEAGVAETTGPRRRRALPRETGCERVAIVTWPLACPHLCLESGRSH